jgi:alanine racemase
VMAMVKANGYGHGMLTAARAALDGGATWLGVSCAEEAQALRQAGIDAPVLVTGWCQPRLAAELIAAGVDLTVYDADSLDAVVAGARQAGRTAGVHLKVDTGMTRLGARTEAVADLCAALSAAGRQVRLRGVFTHFAVAESDDAFTSEQNEGLLRAVECARQLAPDALLHAANSAAALTSPQTWHDLVRAGIAIYGYPPVATTVPLRPAMTVVARVTQLRTVTRGDSVGYGRTWLAERPTRVATVAAGYADGVMRTLSNRGAALLGGRRAPIIGRVSMDQITVDVSDVDGVRAGDVAVLFGVREGIRLDAAEVGEMAGTIANEVVCAVSSRVPRIIVDTAED